MEQIRIVCHHPVCPCDGICCQDCSERADCSRVCSRILYKEAIYSSDAFLVKQMEELAGLSGHWLIQVAAQRLKALDVALERVNPPEETRLAALQNLNQPMVLRWSRQC